MVAPSLAVAVVKDYKTKRGGGGGANGRKERKQCSDKMRQLLFIVVGVHGNRPVNSIFV